MQAHAFPTGWQCRGRADGQAHVEAQGGARCPGRFGDSFLTCITVRAMTAVLVVGRMVQQEPNRWSAWQEGMTKLGEAGAGQSARGRQASIRQWRIAGQAGRGPACMRLGRRRRVEKAAHGDDGGGRHAQDDGVALTWVRKAGERH